MNLIEKINPQNTALIIVDVQNDFCSKDGALGKQGADVGMVKTMMPNLHELIAQSRINHVPIIFIQTIHETATDSASWTNRGSKRNTKHNGVCRKNTWGSDFYEITPQDEEIIVIKHRYSAFINTRLDSVLRTLNIKNLIMTGVATNVCVESTARDGFMLDYNIVFLSDCTASYSRIAHDMTLVNMRGFFGDVTDSQSVIKGWNNIKEEQNVRI